MLLATWLTYGATITLGNVFFVHVMGSVGLDWKVRLIVFVIVVAVGQDYNVFLAAGCLRNCPGWAGPRRLGGRSSAQGR